VGLSKNNLSVATWDVGNAVIWDMEQARTIHVGT